MAGKLNYIFSLINLLKNGVFQKSPSLKSKIQSKFLILQILYNHTIHSKQKNKFHNPDSVNVNVNNNNNNNNNNNTNTNSNTNRNSNSNVKSKIDTKCYGENGHENFFSLLFSTLLDSFIGISFFLYIRSQNETIFKIFERKEWRDSITFVTKAANSVSELTLVNLNSPLNDFFKNFIRYFLTNVFRTYVCIYNLFLAERNKTFFSAASLVLATCGFTIIIGGFKDFLHLMFLPARFIVSRNRQAFAFMSNCLHTFFLMYRGLKKNNLTGKVEISSFQIDQLILSTVFCTYILLLFPTLLVYKALTEAMYFLCQAAENTVGYFDSFASFCLLNFAITKTK